MNNQEEIRGIFPSYFSVPKGDPAKKVKNIKKEFKKFQDGRDYLISSVVNEYLILSKEMKKSIRDMIWEKIPRMEEGHFFSSKAFSYKEGVDSVPDILIILEEMDETPSSDKIQEIDDEEVEKIHQENLEKESKLQEDIEMTEAESSTKNKVSEKEKIKNDENFATSQRECNDNHKSGGGGNKYAIPFIGSGLFLCLIGLIISVAKP